MGFKWTNRIGVSMLSKNTMFTNENVIRKHYFIQLVHIDNRKRKRTREGRNERKERGEKQRGEKRRRDNNIGEKYYFHSRSPLQFSHSHLLYLNVRKV